MKLTKIFAAVAVALSLFAPEAAARDLVILQTNDTHSQIDPTDKGFGGVQRRKVFIDSVRGASPDVLLIDSGDAVQGTLFFTLHGGKVEMDVMSLLGYDVQILGNHDFDNGVEAMARNVARSKASWISTNYTFDNDSVAGLFLPWKVFRYGDRKVGVIGLNLNPEGMISPKCSEGVNYHDAVKVGNIAAAWLKDREDVDLVVAVTHLGYGDVVPPSDMDIAKNSKDIDIILGGHSHTLITPGSGKEWLLNADGDSVLVTQNGKSGQYISEVTVDLDSVGLKKPRLRQVLLDKSYDRSHSAALDSVIEPYRAAVDALMNEKIGTSRQELPNDKPALLNFVSDFCAARGTELAGRKVDLALMNSGSLRRGLPKGDITKGQIISMQPFTNRILVMEISGKDLIDAMNVYAKRNGDGLSSSGLVKYNPATHQITSFTIDGKPVDPAKTYLVATIDYLASGGDYMAPLKNGRIIATSSDIVYDDLIRYITNLRRPISPSSSPRFLPTR